MKKGSDIASEKKAAQSSSTPVVEVTLYTDGACRGNPGPGGWGVFLHWKTSGETFEKELWGGEPSTTNNRMELTAVIRGLQVLPEIFQAPPTENVLRVVVRTDSEYVQKGMTEWISNWKRRGWRTASGSAVKNQDLWQILDTLVSTYSPQWQWVRGHSGNPGNEAADRLAGKGVPV